jgi:hypothetical protein
MPRHSSRARGQPSRARRTLLAGSGLLVSLSIPLPASAHSLGGLSNLPAPLTYFLAGVATALIAAFVVLTIRWPEPRWQAEPAIKPIKVPGWRSIVVLLRMLGIAGLVLVVTTGVVGPPNSVRNPGPVLVWVVFWLVVPFAGAFFGDIYRLVNPWRSLSSLFGPENLGSKRTTDSWGVWPATVAFSGFVWFELVYPNPAHPRHLAIAAVIYTGLLLGIGEWLGRKAAIEQFDAFTTYNRLISAIAPLDLEPDREPGWRGWLRRLPNLPEMPGLTTFVIIMIGAVAFHGMSAAAWFESAFGAFGRSVAGGTLLLLATVGVVGTVYWLTCRLIAGQAGSQATTGSVARRFIHSLVPIALAYAFAHHFTAIVFEGQLIFSTISDPFGLGWNLFGSALRPVDFTILSPTAVWWIQVSAILAGHLSALVLAHDRSLRDLAGPTGVRGRYCLLGLITLLAVAGITILAVG